MKTSSSNSLQFALFEMIKKIIPASTSLSDEMADIFQVSKDSAYRRLRGETALTIDEVYKLCHHYSISFDALCTHQSNMVSFDYNSMRINTDGFSNYLSSIYETLCFLKKSPSTRIIYLAQDIPIFHHFRYPELSAFKMFYWLKLVMNVDFLEGKKFSKEIIPENLVEISNKIYNTYTSIPSVEIWTESTVTSTLKQIKYCMESGQFRKKKDALAICAQFVEELEYLQKQAESNTKIVNDKNKNSELENFMLYDCEIEIGNNCILVKTGDSKTVYITHMTFNKLITTHHDFCNDTEDWLQNLIKKSTLISGSSEKQRYRFFNKAITSITKLMEKIDKEFE